MNADAANAGQLGESDMSQFELKISAAIRPFNAQLPRPWRTSLAKSPFGTGLYGMTHSGAYLRRIGA